MAKIRVKYTVEVEEDIDWPDDELDLLTYENLLLNCDVEKAFEIQYDDIKEVSKDGEYFEFE